MLIILAFIILFHLAAAILLFVATIHNVSINQKWTHMCTTVQDNVIILTTRVSLPDVGVVGGVASRTRCDLH